MELCSTLYNHTHTLFQEDSSSELESESESEDAMEVDEPNWMQVEESPMLICNLSVPHDVLENIFRNFCIKNSASLSLICRTFHYICSKDEIWKIWTKNELFCDSRLPTIKMGVKHNWILVLKQAIDVNIDDKIAASKFNNFFDKILFKRIKKATFDKLETYGNISWRIYEIQLFSTLLFKTSTQRILFPEKLVLKIGTEDIRFDKKFCPQDYDSILSIDFAVSDWRRLSVIGENLRINYEIRNLYFTDGSGFDFFNTDSFINSIKRIKECGL